MDALSAYSVAVISTLALLDRAVGVGAGLGAANITDASEISAQRRITLTL